MKKIRFTQMVIISFIVALCSCSNDDTFTSYDITEISKELSEIDFEFLTVLKESTTVSEEQAELEALSIMQFFDKNDMLKSGTISKRKITNKKIVWHSSEPSATLLKSKGLEEDSISVYTFNFASDNQDSLGYAVVSGDERLPSVIACSDHGALNDTITNPGLGVFLSRVPDYIDSEIERYECEKLAKIDSAIIKLNSLLPDSIQSQIEEDSVSLKSAMFGYSIPVWKISNYNIGEWETNTQYGPLLSNKVRWDQWSPYNDKVDYLCSAHWSGRAPAGCVATAIAQIMAYYEIPNSYNGKSYDWSQMTSLLFGRSVNALAQNQIAELFYEIGQQTNMDYGCDGSGANSSDALRCFSNMGYNTAGEQDYR